jgi:malate dehydrogenase (oxaloacetate-decarboxylating)(NADP+)
MSTREKDVHTRTRAIPHGLDLLHDPLLNKGSAFTPEEREELGLRGLLPPHPMAIDEQVERIMGAYRAKTDDLEKFIYLTALHDRNETLFYRVVVDHIEELMPIIYTPTVGRACQLYGQIFRRSRGMWIGIDDHGCVRNILDNWPHEDVRAIVVTDGERILGLGDLGANGMGIPVGKLSLYTACAGVNPANTLPVTLDVGTDNERLLKDPLYLGLRRHRMRGPAYDSLVEEFVTAANQRWPGVLIQFEDFGNTNAFRLLAKYRERVCTFNDDIQGTAAVTLAGLMSALRVTGAKLKDQRILFLGAGEAGVGIADLIVSAMMEAGASRDEARRACWLVDSQGLVVKSREKLAEHKKHYAHDAPQADTLLDAIKAIKPTALIGVSGQPATFTREIIMTMAELNPRPIIFALSNPTANAECTAEEAYRHTGGRALFASGSPFAPVMLQGKQLIPSQANNAYVFPGVALGIVAARLTRVTDEMFATAARTLAGLLTKEQMASGLLFPPLTEIREVSVKIAMAVAEVGFDRGFSTLPEPKDMEALIREHVFEPKYRNYV